MSMYIGTYRGWWQVLTKTIAVSDEVYKGLLQVKGNDERFSELLERFVEGANSFETLKRLRGK